MKSVAIVILNYNGIRLLAECLPSILKASKKSIHKTKVIVIDNESKDDSVQFLKNNFKDVQVIESKNRVLCSYNDVLPILKEEFVILLNNDIRVDENFVDPLIEKFEKDPSTFLVAPIIMNFNDTAIESAKTVGKMRFGMYWVSGRYPGYQYELAAPSTTFSSGFGAFDRMKFITLGGYDARYLPGIFEDVDLCYRAAKRGYALYYESKSIVYHMGQASFKKVFSRWTLEKLAYRNNFLFIWKNVKGLKPWLNHLLFMPLRIVKDIVTLRFSYIQGLIEAIWKSLKGFYHDRT